MPKRIHDPYGTLRSDKKVRARAHPWPACAMAGRFYSYATVVKGMQILPIARYQTSKVFFAFFVHWPSLHIQLATPGQFLDNLTCPIQNCDDGGLLIKGKNLRQLNFELCHQKWVKIDIIPLISYTSTANDEKNVYLTSKFDISQLADSASLLLLWHSSKDGRPLRTPVKGAHAL